jgi:hypothetical protein
MRKTIKSPVQTKTSTSPDPTVNEQIFKFQTSAIHMKLIGEEPHFFAKDVCTALGITNYRDAVASLDKDESFVSVEPTRSGVKRHQILVNESGLYGLIFQSRKKEARVFRKWVTSEVLPSIRKNGNYVKSQPIQEGVCAGLQSMVVKGHEIVLYTEYLRHIGLSTRSGAVYARIKRIPQFFIKLFGRNFITTQGAEYLHSWKDLRAFAVSVKADNQLKLTL